MKSLKLVLLLSLALSWLQAGAACFTVFDPSDRIVYHSATPPVDMEKPLHETLPVRFPGGHMVFSDTACLPLSAVRPVPTAAREAPLLTDMETAKAMKVPYTVLSGELVMIQEGHGPIRPRVTVIPAVSRARLDAGKTVTTITESRDPPMTIVRPRRALDLGDGAR